MCKFLIEGCGSVKRIRSKFNSMGLDSIYNQLSCNGSAVISNDIVFEETIKILSSAGVKFVTKSYI